LELAASIKIDSSQNSIQSLTASTEVISKPNPRKCLSSTDRTVLDYKYRPDVDGLRAVAVSVVLLFHAGLGFSGGFIGVDVFFVISGFLITGLILKEQGLGTFSLANFWVRRIRRILPAATTLVISVLIAGYFLLLPNDYEDLGKATIAQQLMLSNFYFWKNTGYFDGAAEVKPLLHTWSLAVEEQFYLGYPLLLMFLHPFGRRFTIMVLSCLAIGSLAISQYGVNHYPSASFFLLPTRAWELLMGGLVCFMPQSYRAKPWFLEGASWISISAILACAWCYSSKTPFPGISALVPCTAAAVLIHVNSMAPSTTAVLLASKPMIFLGLISYSLYLWHWPIFAFWRTWFGEPEYTASLVLLSISVVAAVASWRFIETPFRRPKRSFQNSLYYKTAMLSSIVVIAVAAFIFTKGGLIGRYSASDMLLFENALPQVPRCSLEKAERGDFPRIGANDANSPKVLVWGDSHLQSLANVIGDSLANANINAAYAAHEGFPPLLEVWCVGRPRDQILRWNRAVMQFIQTQRVSEVVLVARWTIYMEGRANGDKSMLVVDSESEARRENFAEEAMARSLDRTVKALQELGVRVWVVRQVPEQEGDPAKSILKGRILKAKEVSGTSLAWNVEHHRKANQIINQMAKSRVRLLDTWHYCFDEKENSIIFDGVRTLYKDDNHLSSHGAQYLLSKLFAEFTSEVSDSLQEAMPNP
jgi:peptidoglycan/LPS O-acetylase OafA/YrhL